VSGFDVKPGDKISGTFNYGTPGQSNPSIQSLINGVEYSADVPSFSFHADFVEEGLFRGIGGMDSIDARMGIWMQGAGDVMIGALTGCHNYYDCPTFDGLPASFPFLHQTGAAQLHIRSSDPGGFGFPIDPAAAFSPYYLNADIDSITKVSEPPTLALLLVGLTYCFARRRC
jgi:hypothetical protein